MARKNVTITRKVKHGLDLRLELSKAAEVAQFALDNPDKRSTKFVSHVGLNSTFSDMILRYYIEHPPKTFRSDKVKLLVAGSKVRPDVDRGLVYVPPLRTNIRCEFPKDFLRVRQIMFDQEYAFINMEVKAKEEMEVNEWLGVDLNIVGPLAVIWLPTTREVIPLGDEYYRLVQRYNRLETELEQHNKFHLLKKVRIRRAHKVDDLLHKVSAKIVEIAVNNRCGIRMENLCGIGKKSR